MKLDKAISFIFDTMAQFVSFLDTPVFKYLGIDISVFDINIVFLILGLVVSVFWRGTRT